MGIIPNSTIQMPDAELIRYASLPVIMLVRKAKAMKIKLLRTPIEIIKRRKLVEPILCSSRHPGAWKFENANIRERKLSQTRGLKSIR